MQQQSTAAPPSALRSSAFPWDTAVFVSIAVAVLFGRFLHPAQLLGYYQDDFFYYLKVAQNIAEHGSSTFNGLQLTNGYHPLWMLLLVALCFVFHGTAFFVALQAISLAAAIFSFLLFRRIVMACSTSRIASVGALALGLASLQLMRYGMEVTLTLPLAACFLWMLIHTGPPRTAAAALAMGFVASLVVLSRLDAALLIALCCLAIMPAVFHGRNGFRIAAAFLAGVLPLLLLYVAVQYEVFHLLTPVSGLAKQMKAGHMLSPATWESLLPGDRFRMWVVAPQLLLLALGLSAWFLPPTQRKPSQPHAMSLRHIALAITLFPLVHWTVLSILSDWSLWAWYFYSLTLGCAGACMLLAMGRIRPAAQYLYGAVALVLGVYSAAYVVAGPNSVAILESSTQLANFMDAHPGVWMMGDQAGTTGYLTHQPIIQTEGLVMDRDFLLAMRQGTPLKTIAERYHARYYAFFGIAAPDGCFHLAEPVNAGPTSPRMIGVACTRPLATFYRFAAPIQVIDAASIR